MVAVSKEARRCVVDMWCMFNLTRWIQVIAFCSCLVFIQDLWLGPKKSKRDNFKQIHRKEPRSLHLFHFLALLQSKFYNSADTTRPIWISKNDAGLVAADRAGAIHYHPVSSNMENPWKSINIYIHMCVYIYITPTYIYIIYVCMYIYT